MTDGEHQQRAEPQHIARRGICLLTLLAISMLLPSCATTKRTADLVIDHHLGMVRGAIDILSGEAEAREQRLARLQGDLEQSRAALGAEQDQSRVVEQLRQHVALQDALVAELLQGHGGHGNHCGGHQQAQAETTDPQEPHQH